VQATPGWDFLAIGVEGDPVELGGVELWRTRWEPVAVGTVTVPHPSWPRQRHDFQVYVVRSATGPTFFAAGELSNGVWGFYRPSASMQAFLLRFHS